MIVAKLDRLSRDVHFISGLMAHRVPFIVSELRAPYCTTELVGKGLRPGNPVPVLKFSVLSHSSPTEHDNAVFSLLNAVDTLLKAF